ncbi:MAG: NAD(P)/FAD-dependent oxidoreductase [Eubacteriales bacterium]
MSKVIVIGGGAAGMIAAIAAAKEHHEVILLEKNEKLGRKIYITGKGRCNVTNACEIEEFMEQIVTNKKFLYSSLYTFTNQGIMELLEEAGCPLKVERGNRVFPVSDRSQDVIRALEQMMKRLGIRNEYQCNVGNILVEGQQVEGVTYKQRGKVYTKRADAIVLATGGLSYPLTGSTGEGYEMAKKWGHTITRLLPSLVPFNIEEEWCKDLQGLSLKNVKAKVIMGEKVIYEQFGEMLFTHFGVSGPLMISASSYYGKEENQRKKNQLDTKVIIDLKPALTKEQLDKRIQREFEQSSKKQFKNAISSLYPAKLIPIILQLSGIEEEKRVYEITKQERLELVSLTKALTMTITGTRGYAEAIITKGGIAVKEVNPSTMESKLVKGLYLAGEILDIDALTGGYNLQLAWSTGYLAGMSIE